MKRYWIVAIDVLLLYFYIKYDDGAGVLAREVSIADHVYHISMIGFTSYVGYCWAKDARNRIDRVLFTSFMIHRLIAILYRLLGIVFNFALVWSAPNYLLFMSIAAAYAYLDLKGWQK